jgi:peptidyl-prolyl isomerase G (cyclophilin G)
MEQLGTADGKPTQPIKIVDCGEVSKAKTQHTVEKEKGTCDRDIYLCIIL